MFSVIFHFAEKRSNMDILVPLLKKQLISQILLGIVFQVSAVIITVLHTLLFLVLKPFNIRLYRHLSYYLTYTLNSQIVFILAWWAETDVEFLDDSSSHLQSHYGKENALVIANHQYDIDLGLEWFVADWMKVLGNTKFTGKKSLSLVPIIGWCWRLQEHLFLERNWEKDKKCLGHQIRQLMSDNPNPVWISLAPEGTRFTAEKHKQSILVARAKGLPELKHHLLPRTKGFVYMRQQLSKIANNNCFVYDVTIAVDRGFQGSLPSILNMLKGKGTRCKMFVRRFPLEELPLDEEACANWLHKLFQEKDQIVADYVQTGKVPISFQHSVHVKKRISCLVNFICWAVIVLGPLGYWLLRTALIGQYYHLNLLVFILCTVQFGFKSMTGNIEKGSTYGQ